MSDIKKIDDGGAELSALIEKLEKAEGPDRNLDTRICWTLGLKPWAGTLECHLTHFAVGSKMDKLTPAYTYSIDAAVSLAERVLPGWHWGLTQGDDGDDAGEFQASIWPGVQPFPADMELFGDHDVAAIALVLATLRALQSKGEA